MNLATKKAILIMLAVIIIPVMFAGCAKKKEATPLPSSVKQIDSSREVAAKINIQSDPELAPLGIKVEAKNFTVTLSGTVKSEEQKKRAETLAGSTSGVKEVINNIIVEKQE